MNVEDLVDECKRTAEKLSRSPNAKNRAAARKASALARQLIRVKQAQNAALRETLSLEQRNRKARTRALILIGAEYYRLFLSYDPVKARERMKKLFNDEKEEKEKAGKLSEASLNRKV